MGGEDCTWVNAEAKFSMQMKAANVTPQHRIAIAVSGGADSLALCLLAARWRRGWPDVGAGKCEGLVAFVVDHGLRSGSAEEAIRVRQWVSNLGLVCDILKCVWVDDLPALGHLQESARNARYSLLAQACQLSRAEILLTAHHADDQAELFILRLSRCSGIAGLAGIASVLSFHPAFPACATKGSLPNDLLLIRPLLKFIKEELYTICQVSGQDWIEDPTNLNLNFARNRIRKALKEPPFMGVRTEIQVLIAFCRKVRSTLDRDRDRLLSEVSMVSQKWGHITIDVDRLLSSGVSNAVLHRGVGALMQFVAQRAKPPRGRVIGSIIKHLRARNSKVSPFIFSCVLIIFRLQDETANKYALKTRVRSNSSLKNPVKLPWTQPEATVGFFLLHPAFSSSRRRDMKVVQTGLEVKESGVGMRAFTAGGCNIFPAPGSKGSRAIICFSPDSPPPSVPRAACLDKSIQSLSSKLCTPASKAPLLLHCLDQSIQSLSSESCTPATNAPLLLHVDPGDPIPDKSTANAISRALAVLALDIKTPRTAVHEFQGLGLMSEAAASLLRELASDISRDMGKQPANQSEETWRVKWTSTSRECLKTPISFDRSQYFLDRFVVSSTSRIQDLEKEGGQPFEYDLDTQLLPRDCPVVRQKMWIRHCEERDWVYLSRLAARVPDTQGVRVCNLKADMMSSNPFREDLSKLDCTEPSKHHARGLNKRLRSITAPNLHDSHVPSSPSSVKKDSANPLHNAGPCRRPRCQIERFSKAKDAVAQLQTIPKLVRRGLPVIVTTQGLLLGMPSVGYTHCPLASMTAVFCPRTPLGGGQASWL